MEVTMTVPGAIEVISELLRNNPGLLVGGGSLLDVEKARRCLDAGASFLTSPGLDVEIVELAANQETVVFPGAATPSEVMLARKISSDFVKVFPCSFLGGPAYLKTLRIPFPDVQFIASGGVNQQNATEYFLAGAVAVGIGRDLIQPAAIKRREVGWIRELSRRYLKMVKEARSKRGNG